MRTSVVLLLTLCLSSMSLLHGQSLGNAGTIEGMVTDPSGAVVATAKVDLQNRITGYKRTATTDTNGALRFPNVPLNSYHLEVDAAGFNKAQQDVAVRTAVTVPVKVALTLAGSTTEVTVESGAADLIESVPYAHNDIDHAQLSKLPATSPGSGLSD